MSLKVPRRSSLDEGTREYLEMGMDLTNKRKRYFSFHENALNRRQDRTASLESSDSKDIIEETDNGSTTETTVDVTRSSNQLSVNNYKEMVKQCLLDSAKGLTNGYQLLLDIESSTVDLDTLNRCPKQLKNLIVLWACFVNKCNVVETFTKAAGNSVNYVIPNKGYSALHISALSGCVNCIKYILKFSGCEPDSRVDDMTALHFATFTDSIDVMRTLVDYGCRFDTSVLHTAAKSRAVECIKLMLFKYQVDVNTLDTTGMAPIHICADRGFSDCLKILLSWDKTQINLKDHQQFTALHLACVSAQVECVKLLIEYNANVNAKNMKSQVPIHKAAKAQSVDCIDLLIKAGADVNARDIEDRTPLHTAISHKTLNASLAVDALLSYHAKVNVQDHYGFTPLHLAALNEVPECVESLLAKGGNVGIKTYGGISTLNMIMRKVPSCLPAISRQLDSAVTSNWAADGFKRDLIIQFRFNYLLNYNDFGEIDLLKCFQIESQYELLQHPLCQAFLFLKWRKMRKYYLMRLVSLGFFILLYTFYLMTVLRNNCYYTAAKSISGTYANTSNTSNLYPPDQVSNSNNNQTTCFTTNINIMHVNISVLYLLCIIEGFFKISEIASYIITYRYFFCLSNISEWLVLISVPCVSFHFREPANWQNLVGAFCALITWTNLMIKIGQLPWFDTYVAMYTKVQKEFAKLLLAYICLLIGFSVSLCVVFPKNESFSNPFVGFVKVLVMMAGELDFEIVNGLKTEGMSKFTAYVVYTALLIFVSIILMNLLVGIAVHDIQGLRKTAGLSKIRCQINLIHYIEIFMLKSFWPKSIKRRALVFPSKNRTHLTIESMNPNQPLPRDIIEAARVLIKRKNKNCTDEKETFKIQEILKEIRDLRTVVETNQKVIKHLLMNANTP